MEVAPTNTPSPENRQLQARMEEVKFAYEKVKSLNFYERLGFSSNDTIEDIKNQPPRVRLNFSFLVDEKLPNPLKEELNKIADLFQEARDTLTDPKRREEYDLTLKLEERKKYFDHEIKMLEEKWGEKGFKGFNAFKDYESWRHRAVAAAEARPEDFDKSEEVKKLALMGLNKNLTALMEFRKDDYEERYNLIAKPWVDKGILTQEEIGRVLNGAKK